ncbi:MAG: acylphosphatase [Chloroflexota bacterium]
MINNHDLTAVRVVVRGYVQGVFFRAFTEREANAFGLKGYVSNLPDGESVEVRAEGERRKLQKLIELLRTGPPLARVKKIEIEWMEYSGLYTTFRVK